MPTPMSAFADVAQLFACVDPADEAAVGRFFSETLGDLPEAVRQAVLVQLLERDGEPERVGTGVNSTTDALLAACGPVHAIDDSTLLTSLVQSPGRTKVSHAPSGSHLNYFYVGGALLRDLPAAVHECLPHQLQWGRYATISPRRSIESIGQQLVAAATKDPEQVPRGTILVALAPTSELAWAIHWEESAESGEKDKVLASAAEALGVDANEATRRLPVCLAALRRSRVSLKPATAPLPAFA